MEEPVPGLGIAPGESPTIANGGDDALIVGVDHLCEFDPKALERLRIAAQGVLGRVDPRKPPRSGPASVRSTSYS